MVSVCWKKNQKGLELSGRCQFLVCVDKVNILDGNTNSIKKTKKALLKASREVGLEENAERIHYMFMSHHHNTGQN